MNTTTSEFSIGNFKDTFGAVVILIIIIAVSCWCSLYIIQYLYYKTCIFLRTIKRKLRREEIELLVIIYEILFGSVINTRNISYILEN